MPEESNFPTATRELVKLRGQALDEEQLGALVATIALIDAYNRFDVILNRPAGDHQPGQPA